MSDNNKTYRIRTNVGEDNVLNVNVNQDFNVLEVLSLKISTDNLYKLHTANYGCVTGRVLANGGYGIPNAKVSIFIAAEAKDMEDDILSYLYPYKTANTKNSDKIRYNLLPEDQLSDCHRNVGTFPSKRTVLDDDNVLEVYDKYYKFTTRTNESGDYMIFGVPTGSQTLHVDLDLSDIGILSQRPRDMIYKGYNISQFENANMFKKSEDLDSLAQIFSQNQSVYVYPFWGEESESEIAITRCDIEVQYEFTPTCIFMGSLITDEGGSGISKRCIPSEKMGKMDELVTGNGTIEMIRKTADGSVEDFVIQGNALIDGDGVWCYQIPMNLDYVRTDEFGNVVRTDDVTKGIPTRASVRFRFSLTEFENEGGLTHLSKVLVPNNPKYYTSKERTEANLEENERRQTPILDYKFGSLTDEASFKDLFSNNVYTVKSFIPRFQMLNLDRNKRFSGIKAVNDNGANNPIPYNNIRVDLTFMFVLQCAVFKVLLWVIGAYNNFMSKLYNTSTGGSITRGVKKGIQKALKSSGRCLYIGEGYCPEMEGWYFAPKCWENEIFNKTYTALKTKDNGTNQESDGAVVDNKSIDYTNSDDSANGGRLCLTRKIDYFIQCVEINLAMEYNVIQFDFYNDWINGLLYVPRWMADMRPKRTFLFGTFKVRSKINACLENGYRAIFSRRYAQQCALTYGLSKDGTFTDITSPNGCKTASKQKCHKSKGRKTIKILSTSSNGSKPGGGIVHEEYTLQGKYAYYLRPCEWLSMGRKCNLFATDIVLLGSMEKNNIQGLPQTFEKLQSSTFNLPDTLATTNLGIDGGLYGSSSNLGTICNGAVDEAPERLQSTASSVVEWTRGKDEYENNPYDKDEENDIVTEAAGIDWGYTGPGQDVTGNEVGINNLYYPGGHFLGVSCFNSQTNIKSCVNLSRICEAGAMISQRQMVLVPTKTNGEMDGGSKPKFLVPTGLISNNEINDYGLRNEFATLNYNGLKTKINNGTLLREYDFETVYPINFDGSLSKKISGKTAYNEFVNADDKKITIEENSTDYYRYRLGLPKGFTTEEAKKKYLISSSTAVSLPVYENSFYFYFGLKSGSTAIDKFYKNFYAKCPELKAYEPEVVLTIEQNASLCKDDGIISVLTTNIDNPTVKIEFTTRGGETITRYASSDNRFTGLTGDITYTVTVDGDNDVSIANTLTIPKDLPSSFGWLNYRVNNYGEEAEFLDDDFEACGRIVFNGDSNLFNDENILALSVHLNNDAFKKEGKLYAKWYLNSNALEGKTLEANQHINEKFYCLSSGYTDDLREITSGITAWKGNDNYVITAWYDCHADGNYWCCEVCSHVVESAEEPTHRCEVCGANEWTHIALSNIKESELATEYISMPEDYNIIFDNYEFASYKYLIKPMIKKYGDTDDIKKDWFNALFLNSRATSLQGELKNLWEAVSEQEVFSGDEGKKRLADAIYHLRRALFYRNSQAELGQISAQIPITIVGGNEIYDINEIISGIGEQIIDTDTYPLLNLSQNGTASELSDSGFSMNIENFIAPTRNITEVLTWLTEINEAPSYKEYFYDYYRVSSKSPYRIKIGTTINEFYLPSLYRPFFFRALYVSRINGQYDYGQYYENVIVNPLSRNLYNVSQTEAALREEHTAYSGAKVETIQNDYSYSRGLIPERFYTYRHVSDYSRSIITGGVYNVSIKENYDTDGSFDEERKMSISGYFFGDGNGYDTSVRYFPIDEALADALYAYSNGIWGGATVMDRAGEEEFMNYFFPSSGVAENEMGKIYYVLANSAANGGYLWSPFLSAMLKETHTNTNGGGSIIPYGNLDFDSGLLCKNSPHMVNQGSQASPHGAYFNRGDVYMHLSQISSTLILNAALDPTNEANIKNLEDAFNYQTADNQTEKHWGCVGITEIPYSFVGEFGENNEDFGAYSKNKTNELYTISPRHASTLTVMRIYSRDAFIRLVTHPNLKYYESGAWQ